MDSVFWRSKFAFLLRSCNEFRVGGSKFAFKLWADIARTVCSTAESARPCSSSGGGGAIQSWLTPALSRPLTFVDRTPSVSLYINFLCTTKLPIAPPKGSYLYISVFSFCFIFYVFDIFDICYWHAGRYHVSPALADAAI